ncbi:MAG: hypothetical protein MUF72_18620 [Elainella sp. Prado103]|jgi:hypothetical protein|nr:hypothetical protein [Elainella sp. Prado103]
MVQASKPESRLPHPVETVSLSALLDPALLQAARTIYRTYYEVHPDETLRPIGVALDRFSLRGKLIFGGKPILLPRECFVPLNQIEPGIR